MKVIALTSFVHGPLNLNVGDKADFSDGTAADLASRGLVREVTDADIVQTNVRVPLTTRAAIAVRNKKAPELVNKADDATPKSLLTESQSDTDDATSKSLPTESQSDAVVNAVSNADLT